MVEAGTRRMLVLDRRIMALMRGYERADREACLSLFDSNVPPYFAPSERADFAAFLDDLPGPYLVLEDLNGDIVACGGFGPTRQDDTVAILCWGMVRRDQHGRGLGRQLLATRLDLIATDPRFRAVRIETSPLSRGFFERFGFIVDLVVPDGFAPGLDLVAMALDLGGSGANPRA